MKISDKCLAKDSSKPHICIDTPVLESERITDFSGNPSLNPLSYTEESLLRNRRLNNLEFRNRVNSFTKFERKKQTSSERRRTRIRSMALGEESEFFIGIKKENPLF